MLMVTLVIIYDSKTGNTEKMAESIAEGANSVSGATVLLKKIGTPFSLRILDGADAVILGSPAHYAHVTPEMRSFLESLREEIAAGRLGLEGKAGAAFGSYGWDGGVAIERLARDMEDLGIRARSHVLAKGPPLPYSSQKKEFLRQCQEFGKTLAEEISKR